MEAWMVAVISLGGAAAVTGLAAAGYALTRFASNPRRSRDKKPSAKAGPAAAAPAADGSGNPLMRTVSFQDPPVEEGGGGASPPTDRNLGGGHLRSSLSTAPAPPPGDVMVRITGDTAGLPKGATAVLTDIGGHTMTRHPGLYRDSFLQSVGVRGVGGASAGKSAFVSPGDIEIIRESDGDDVIGTSMAPFHLGLTGKVGKIRGFSDGYIVTEFPGDAGSTTATTTTLRLLPAHLTLLRAHEVFHMTRGTDTAKVSGNEIAALRHAGLGGKDAGFVPSYTTATTPPGVGWRGGRAAAPATPAADSDSEASLIERTADVSDTPVRFASPGLGGAPNVVEIASFSPFKVRPAMGHPAVYYAPDSVSGQQSYTEGYPASGTPAAIDAFGDAGASQGFPPLGRGRSGAEAFRSIRHYLACAVPAGVRGAVGSPRRPAFKPKVTFQGAPPEPVPTPQQMMSVQNDVMRDVAIAQHDDGFGAVSPVYSSLGPPEGQHNPQSAAARALSGGGGSAHASRRGQHRRRAQKNRHAPPGGLYSYENTTLSAGFVPRVNPGYPAGSQVRALSEAAAARSESSQHHSGGGGGNAAARSLQTSPERRYALKERVREAQGDLVEEYIDSLRLEDAPPEAARGDEPVRGSVRSPLVDATETAKLKVVSQSPLARSGVLKVASLFSSPFERKAKRGKGGAASPQGTHHPSNPQYGSASHPIGSMGLTRKLRIRRVSPLPDFHSAVLGFWQQAVEKMRRRQTSAGVGGAADAAGILGMAGGSTTTHPNPSSPESVSEAELRAISERAFNVRGGPRELFARLCMLFPDSYADRDLEWLRHHTRGDTYAGYLEIKLREITPKETNAPAAAAETGDPDAGGDGGGDTGRGSVAAAAREDLISGVPGRASPSRDGVALFDALSQPRDFVIPFPTAVFVRNHPDIPGDKPFLILMEGQRCEGLPVYRCAATNATLLSEKGIWVIRSTLQQVLMAGAYPNEKDNPLETLVWEQRPEGDAPPPEAIPGGGSRASASAAGGLQVNPLLHLVEAVDDQLGDAGDPMVIAGAVVDVSPSSFEFTVPDTVTHAYFAGKTVRIAAMNPKESLLRADGGSFGPTTLYASTERSTDFYNRAGDAGVGSPGLPGTDSDGSGGDGGGGGGLLRAYREKRKRQRRDKSKSRPHLTIDVLDARGKAFAEVGDTLALRHDPDGYYIVVASNPKKRFYLPASPFGAIGRLRRLCRSVGVNEALHAQWEALRRHAAETPAATDLTLSDTRGTAGANPGEELPETHPPGLTGGGSSFLQDAAAAAASAAEESARPLPPLPHGAAPYDDPESAALSHPAGAEHATAFGASGLSGGGGPFGGPGMSTVPAYGGVGVGDAPYEGGAEGGAAAPFDNPEVHGNEREADYVRGAVPEEGRMYSYTEQDDEAAPGGRGGGAGGGEPVNPFAFNDPEDYGNEREADFVPGAVPPPRATEEYDDDARPLPPQPPRRRDRGARGGAPYTGSV